MKIVSIYIIALLLWQAYTVPALTSWTDNAVHMHVMKEVQQLNALKSFTHTFTECIYLNQDIPFIPVISPAKETMLANQIITISKIMQEDPTKETLCFLYQEGFHCFWFITKQEIFVDTIANAHRKTFGEYIKRFETCIKHLINHMSPEDLILKNTILLQKLDDIKKRISFRNHLRKMEAFYLGTLISYKETACPFEQNTIERFINEHMNVTKQLD